MNGRLRGKRKPQDVVIAVPAVPVDRAALRVEIAAAKSVKELAAAIEKFLTLLR